MARLPGFGLGPDSALAKWVTRVSGGRLAPNATRIVTFAAGLALALGFVALFGFIQVSSTPQFCGTCHIMKPYYESWKVSAHSKIACVECHISPGVGAEIRKKYEAMSMVVKYFTATYGTKPWAEVDDAACLRCHDRRLIEGKVQYHMVTFDHRPHLTETRRGMKLRCTSCHSQIVQGTHIAVTTSTCAICHFKGQAPNAGTGRCLTCHTIPDRVQTASGAPFNHKQVRESGMDCRGCHAAVVSGDGAVPKERCQSCHNQPDRLEKINEPDFLHQMHVTEHKVDCVDCHLTIEHGQKPPVPAIAEAAGDCERCHGSGHSPQQQLYSGRGGRGVPDGPSPMFLAGVTCEGCHDVRLSPAANASDEAGPHNATASDVSCMACHGPRYKGMFATWKASIGDRVEGLRRQLDATVGAMGADPPKPFEDALWNFRLVARGHGVHNVSYSYALLEKAFNQMNAARQSKGMAALGRPWKVIAPNSAACLSCHMGIDRRTGAFEGHAFSHGSHLGEAKLECGACHRPHAEKPPGEVVKFGRSGCANCHHTPGMPEAKCASCHGDVKKRTIASRLGEFSHVAHDEQGLDCKKCHTMQNEDPIPARTVCAECHVD